MKGKRWWSIPMFIGIFLVVGMPGTASWSQTAPTVREMQISGEIAQSRHGYIIRGKVPAEIFTILNPYPQVLEKYIGAGRIHQMDVRIVSGDNVEIRTINGKKYGPDEK